DFYLLGSVTLQQLQKPTEAAHFYHQALRQNPQYFGAHFGLFLCKYDLKDLPGRLEPLTACLALRPADPMLYYLRGMTYFELEQFELAFLDFDASVERDAKFKLGYFYRGRMHILRGKELKGWEDAAVDFSQALALDAKFADVYPWRGIARAKLDQYRSALED